MEEKLRQAESEMAAANEEIHRLRQDFEQRKRALLEISENSGSTHQLKRLSEMRRLHKERQVGKITTTAPAAASSGDLGSEFLLANPEQLSGVSPRGGPFDSAGYSSIGRKSESFEPPHPREHVRESVFARLMPAGPEVNPKRSIVSPAAPTHAASYPDDGKWGCRGTITDAHPAQVFSLKQFGNLLFSGSNRSFKVWNLDTLQQISDVQAH